MHKLALLSLLPAVLACLDPSKNACASFMNANKATASAFCATFTRSLVTTTQGLPVWATNCSNKPSLLSKKCSCYFTGNTAPPTIVKATTAAEAPTIKTMTGLKATTTNKATTLQTSTVRVTAAPLEVTTALPKSSGAVSTSAAITVKAGQTFDGGMKNYDRWPRVCQEQKETGEADAMFVLEDGATLQNVIIGPNQAEGVHCKGRCNIINVWWQDVCEDAITLKQSSGTSNIIGGGAFKASDKIVQFNGFGTVNIRNFYAKDYGKVARSCGNCKTNGKGSRHIVLENIKAVDGGVLCGINTNYGDTCTIKSSCQKKNKTCDRFTGNNSGKEPNKIGSGADGQYCKVSSFVTSC